MTNKTHLKRYLLSLLDDGPKPLTYLTKTAEAEYARLGLWEHGTPPVFTALDEMTFAGSVKARLVRPADEAPYTVFTAVKPKPIKHLPEQRAMFQLHDQKEMFAP